MAELPLMNNYNNSNVHGAFKRHQVELLSVISRQKKMRTRNYRDPDVRNMETVVESLLAKGADVNTASSTGDTPLLAATRKGFSHVTKLLIQNNANVNYVGKYKQTPLHLSVQHGYIDVVKILVENGANVNAKQKSQVSPLHIAALEGYLSILKLLLRHGADINDQQEEGATALHLAAENGHALLVETLLQSGADVNILNCNGEVAFAVAIDGTIYNYGSDHYMDNYVRSIKAIVRHLVKMQTAKLYLCVENLKHLSNGEVEDCVENCMEEIDKMFCVHFNNTNVSFCDILIKNSGAVARLLRNECITKEIGSESYKEKYPLYGDLIEAKINKGLERNRLLENCNPLFSFLFYQLPALPYDCIENILNFLDNEELRDLYS